MSGKGDTEAPLALVAGAGVIGLTAALTLARQGWRVAVLADAVEGTTSELAGAAWEFPPFEVEAGSVARVARWAECSLRVYRELAASAPSAKVTITRDTILWRTPKPLEEREWPGMTPEQLRRGVSGFRFGMAALRADDALLRQAREQWREGGGYSYEIATAHMPSFMAWLRAQLAAAGVRVARRRFCCARDLALEAAQRGAAVVVNATGLGAREVAADRSVFPTRGQVVVVRAPQVKRVYADLDHPDGDAYIIPRGDGGGEVVLGGTVEHGSASTAPDPRTARRIVARCADVLPCVATAPVIRHVAGLRPSRSGGPRVELDASPSDASPCDACSAAPSAAAGAPVPTVHAYGFGGAGMTACWGAAEEVAQLCARTASPPRAARSRL